MLKSFIAVAIGCSSVFYSLSASSQVTETLTITAHTELRYCGAPARNADGSIKRSQTVVKVFKRIHPCPSTLLLSGACPGWAVDHVIPLACGGCDSVVNMQWLPDAIKSSAQEYAKDRWERKIYERTSVYDGPGCSLQLVR